VIVVVPDETARTNPEDDIVATETLLLLHVPPDVASLSVIVLPPSQIGTEPVIAATAGDTVNTIDAKHPPVTK
jgi:hypothetical protein